jgi:hypothetical protein
MKFDKNGNELGHNILDFNEINEDFNVGLFWDIVPTDSVFVVASYFGNSQWSNTAPPGEIIFDTTNFLTNFSLIKYKHYLENNEPYNIRKVLKNKLLSNSTYDQPYNWDISLSKLNLNLEYDTLDTGTYNYDSLCIPGPPQSGFISVDDCDIVVNIDEMPSPEMYYESIRWIPIKAFPNPVKEGKVTFEFENTDHHRNMEILVYNIFGSEVSRQGVYSSQQTTKTDITAWPAGIYLAVIFSNGGAVGRVKFVVK